MRLSRRNFFMSPPTPGLRKRDIDGATNCDVSQPIKPTAPEQSVLFTWPACEDGGSVSGFGWRGSSRRHKAGPEARAKNLDQRLLREVTGFSGRGSWRRGGLTGRPSR